jgi:hypothetical protein
MYLKSLGTGSAASVPTLAQIQFSDIAGTLGIAAGGTGQTTATAAFNALSPLTTEGDLTYYHSSSNSRLGIGSANTYLTSNGTDPSWGALTGAGFGSQTVNTVLAAPSGASGNPSFRALVTADLPGSGAATVNGQTCTLNASCNVNSGASQYTVAVNGVSGAAIGGVGPGTSNQLLASGGGSANPSYKSYADLTPTGYAAGAGTAQAQTVTLAPSATALTAGLVVRWKPTAANTAAAPTLAVNGLTATTITKCGTTALVASDLTTNNVATAVYDGTEFQLLNPMAAACGAGNLSTSGSPSQYQVGVFASGSTLGGISPSATSGVPLVSQGSSANPAFGTVAIAGGGTGATSAANALINLFPTASEAGDLVYCATYSSGCTAWNKLAGNTSNTQWLQETSAGVPSWTIPTTTVNSQSCAAGSTCTIPFQTNSTSNTSQAGLNLLTSTANTVGLTVTPTNSATNQLKFEITGSSYTGNAATATALASAPTLCSTGYAPTGILASGNATGCASLTASGMSNPMTTEGDMIYETSSTPTRLAVGAAGTVLAGGTDPNYTATPNVTSLSTGSGSCTFGTAGTACLAQGTAPTASSTYNQIYAGPASSPVLMGHLGTAATGPVEVANVATPTGTYSAALTDYYILCNSASGFTVTLPITGQTTGKTYRIKNINTGTCSVAAASGNVDGQTTVPISQWSSYDFVYNGTQYYIF